MNAAVRAVVRSACALGLAVTGIRRGYAGLIASDLVAMGPRSVSGLVHRGGTVLMSSRCPEMFERAGRKRAADTLRAAGIDSLVTIGGNGTIKGALALFREERVRIAHVPSTIDNDLPGTDITIGFDTAVNTAVVAIDRLRDTAASHGRVMLVEVMGRHNGHIAVDAAIGGGAEAAFIPEEVKELTGLKRKLRAWKAAGKSSLIIVVAEGDEAGGAFRLADRLRKATGLDIRTCVLGHTQRGGTPTARDRVLASAYGAAAVDALAAGKSGVMVAFRRGRFTTIPLARGDGPSRPSDPARFRLLGRLA